MFFFIKPGCFKMRTLDFPLSVDKLAKSSTQLHIRKVLLWHYLAITITKGSNLNLNISTLEKLKWKGRFSLCLSQLLSQSHYYYLMQRVNLAVSYYTKPSAFTSNSSSYIYHLNNLKEQNPSFWYWSIFPSQLRNSLQEILDSIHEEDGRSDVAIHVRIHFWGRRSSRVPDQENVWSPQIIQIKQIPPDTKG